MKAETKTDIAQSTIKPKVLEKWFAAAEDGKAKRLAKLLEKYPDLLMAKHDELGCTALHRASIFGEIECVRFLVERGASINSYSKSRDTPLHEAATGHAQTLAVLIFLAKSGADLEAKNRYGDTPLQQAVKASNLPGFSYLIAAGARTDVSNRRKEGLYESAIFQWESKSLQSQKKFARQKFELRYMIEVILLLNGGQE